MAVTPQAVLLLLAIGVLAGWLAGTVRTGRGLGAAGDLIVGVVGAFAGAWMFNRLGLAGFGLFGMLLIALGGAALLLFLFRV